MNVDSYMNGLPYARLLYHMKGMGKPAIFKQKNLKEEVGCKYIYTGYLE